MRIYIESTIPSYVVARPARDLLQAGRQQVTRDWWDLKRSEHELFTSLVVLDEIRCGDAGMAQQRLALMKGMVLLRVNQQSETLTQRFLDSGVLPIGADRDAAHIALATIYKMDVLLSWNLRHIVNAAIQSRLRKVAEDFGCTLSLLCTPQQLTGDLYEEPGENN